LSRLRTRLEALWNKTTERTKLTITERILFCVLCVFELFYRIVFYLVNNYKRAFGNKRSSFFRVIGVGNLSVGGTGKSVFVQFLVRELGAGQCAIALRGYKSSAERSGKSFLVSDGKQLFGDVATAGDEAFMLVQLLHVPVVVGKNRAASCALLEGWYKDFTPRDAHMMGSSGQRFQNDLSTKSYQANSQKISVFKTLFKRRGLISPLSRGAGVAGVSRDKAGVRYLILDDAYQHHTLKKDLEILLLDARHPFENGHCLPAGRLREKDYTRANVIVLTHADVVSEQERERIKTAMLPLFDRHKIFCGKHVIDGIYYGNDPSRRSLHELLGATGSQQSGNPIFIRQDLEEMNYQQSANSVSIQQELKNNIKKVSDSRLPEEVRSTVSRGMLVFAGIGSFSNFVHTVQNQGIEVAHTIDYHDHHAYTKQDLEAIAHILQTQNLEAAITTSKDWCKIEPLMKKYDLHIPVYVLHVKFEFLSMREYDLFMSIIGEGKEWTLK